MRGAVARIVGEPCIAAPPPARGRRQRGPCCAAAQRPPGGRRESAVPRGLIERAASECAIGGGERVPRPHRQVGDLDGRWRRPADELVPALLPTWIWR